MTKMGNTSLDIKALSEQLLRQQLHQRPVCTFQSIPRGERWSDAPWEGRGGGGEKMAEDRRCRTDSKARQKKGSGALEVFIIQLCTEEPLHWHSHFLYLILLHFMNHHMWRLLGEMPGSLVLMGSQWKQHYLNTLYQSTVTDLVYVQQLSELSSSISRQQFPTYFMHPVTEYLDCLVETHKSFHNILVHFI